MRWFHAGLVAGVALFLVGCVFHFVLVPAVPGLRTAFEDADVLRRWSGWTRYYMAIHPFVYGFVFSAGFLALRRFALELGVRGGLAYGAGVFAVGSLPVYALVFAAFQVSPAVVGCWIVQSLAQYTVAGMALGCVCDGVTVQMSSILPANEVMVWNQLLRKATFLFITDRMVSYSDADEWPETLFVEGEVLEPRVRLFGRGPSLPHSIEVVRVDGNQREIETSERGGVVRVWRHRMKVSPSDEIKGCDDNCRYTDTIEVQAGAATPFVWLFVVIFYWRRHQRWRLWLETQ